MRHVDDAIDIAVSTFMIALMLTVGVWSYAYLRNMSATAVYEKTAPLVPIDNGVYETHEYTARDLLLMLVANDALIPKPGVVVFSYNGGAPYTVEFNSAWFKDKEASINKAWNSFFASCINAKHSTWTAVFNTDGTQRCWAINIYD